MSPTRGRLLGRSPTTRPGEFMLRALLKDPIVKLGAFVLGGTMLPYFLPWVSQEQLASWSVLYSEIPILLVCILAFQFRLRRLGDPEEVRFWNLWTLAAVAWLAQAVMTHWTYRIDAWTVWSEVVLNVLYLLFYIFATLALESRFRLGTGPRARALRTIELAGTLVFFTGLLIYFAVIPAVLDQSAYDSSSMLLYVALDFYLAYRLVSLLRATSEPVWRRVYGWLLLSAVLWLVTDTAEMLLWADFLPWVEDGTLLDLFWYLPYATLILAARVRELPAPAVPSPHRETSSAIGPLVMYVVSFPVLHFTLQRMDLAVPILHGPREYLTLVLLVALTAMVFVHLELLRLENRRLEEERDASRQEIEHLAYHDTLTGVPNRRLLEDRMSMALGRARRYDWKLAVMLLDLDDFKKINDTLGHDAGDEVLREVSRRLRRVVRDNDTVARLGGDEFVIMVEGVRSNKEPGAVAGKMLGTLREGIEVGDGQSVDVSATVGTALFPDDGETLEALLGEADRSMYRHKGRKGSRAESTWPVAAPL